MFRPHSKIKALNMCFYLSEKTSNFISRQSQNPSHPRSSLNSDSGTTTVRLRLPLKVCTVNILPRPHTLPRGWLPNCGEWWGKEKRIRKPGACNVVGSTHKCAECWRQGKKSVFWHRCSLGRFESDSMAIQRRFGSFEGDSGFCPMLLFLFLSLWWRFKRDHLPLL